MRPGLRMETSFSLLLDFCWPIMAEKYAVTTSEKARKSNCRALVLLQLQRILYVDFHRSSNYIAHWRTYNEPFRVSKPP